MEIYYCGTFIKHISIYTHTYVCIHIHACMLTCTGDTVECYTMEWGTESEAIDYQIKTWVPGVVYFFSSCWLVGSQRTPPKYCSHYHSYCQCSWFPPEADGNTWKNHAGTYLVAPSLLSSFHSAGRCLLKKPHQYSYLDVNSVNHNNCPLAQEWHKCLGSNYPTFWQDSKSIAQTELISDFQVGQKPMAGKIIGSRGGANIILKNGHYNNLPLSSYLYMHRLVQFSI